MMVYDLIPIFAPHFATRDLTGYFVDLVRVCDSALVISDATASDLRCFAKQHHLPIPEITKAPLGSALRTLSPVQPSALSQASIGSGFVLVVGTITMRKNHHLLLDVWEMMLADLGRAHTPPLVIVGAPGGLSDETMARLKRNPLLCGIVIHLEHATDAELAWLYSECTFTVYPSLYEGWGLPVTESHDFGKVCLASNRTSLVEAGAGLAVHLDAIDRGAWYRAVLQYWTQDDLRRLHETEIDNLHHATTGNDTAAAVLRAARLFREELPVHGSGDRDEGLQ
jgi:glycosyltransferase involved in cell wall biosynthesis